MLLVDDDDRQPGQGGEYGQPRADDDPRASLVRGQPGGGALASREATVQRHDAVVWKSRTDLRLELRREIDLGHQQQRLRVRSRHQRAFDGGEVNLRLAAAGHTEQQERCKPCCLRNLLNCGRLFNAQHRPPHSVGASAGGQRGAQPGDHLCKARPGQLS